MLASLLQGKIMNMPPLSQRSSSEESEINILNIDTSKQKLSTDKRMSYLKPFPAMESPIALHRGPRSVSAIQSDTEV